jgi:hypothetical protein
MSMLSLHWAPTPSYTACATSNSVFECSSYVLVVIMASLAFFLAWGTVAGRLLRMTRFSRLERRTQLNLVSYAMSSIHHSVNVSIAIWAIYVHLVTGVPPYEVLEVAGSIFVGYVVADLLLYVIPARDTLFLFHHSVVIALGAALLASDPRLLRWLPTLLLCEASSFGLIVSYVLLKLGRSDSFVSVVANAYFLCVFVFVRVIHLGAAVFAILFAPALTFDRAAFGLVGLGALLVLWLLQLAWLVPVVRLSVRGMQQGCKPRLSRSPP